MEVNCKLKIQLLIMDVDGTLTDGKIYISDSGELFKAFSVKDGYAIVYAKKHGVEPIIITSRESKITELRCKELGIKYLFQGVADKLSILNEIMMKLGISNENVAYIGDDMNDLECMRMCGYTACPFDAVDDIKKAVNYVCKAKGGCGAVREFIETFININ